MRLLHIADLHFGKSLHECSLIEEDQPYWKDKFLELVSRDKPDAVLIAGDVYDRSTPSGEAVKLLDEMITELSEKNIKVFMVSGNHDSGQKLSFGSRLLEKQNIYISGILSEELMHVTLYDEYGPVTFWMMPYIFPALAASVLKDNTIHDYDTAVRRILEKQDIDFSQRNVIIAHQNVTVNGAEAERGGSETMVGGVGAVDYTAFDGFTYAALGHIHAAQSVGRNEVRYAGSPLCYHFSETKQNRKGPVLIELGDVNEAPKTDVILIEPLHNMREITGDFETIIKNEMESDKRNEYVRVVLTDGRLRPDAAEQLRAVFASHGTVMLEIVNEINFSGVSKAPSVTSSQKSTGEMFRDFFFERNGDTAPDEKENEIIDFLSHEVSRHIGEEKCSDPSDDSVEEFLKFIFSQEEK